MITALGGTGMIDGDIGDFDLGEGNKIVHLDMTCEAPTSEIAQEIVRAIDEYVKTTRQITQNGIQHNYFKILETPWKAFQLSMLATSGWFRGDVTAREKMLSFKEIGFHKLGYGVPALVAWLRDKGCTDFTFTVREERDDEN